MGRSCAYSARNLKFLMVIQTVWPHAWNAYYHFQVQALPCTPQPTGRGPFLWQGSRGGLGGHRSWEFLQSCDALLQLCCSACRWTHTGRDDDSDINPSWSVTLPLSRANAFPLSNWYNSPGPAAIPDCICSVTLEFKKSPSYSSAPAPSLQCGPLCFPHMQQVSSDVWYSELLGWNATT